VAAIEPSAVMRAQRPPDAAPCIDGVAEELPFRDGSFGAVMAVCSDWFWPDRATGFAEMRRVARERVLVLTLDRSVAERFWLSRDYLPHSHELWGPFEETLADFGPCETHSVPIPGDCLDGFFHAYWRRPDAYLNPEIRESMAVLQRLDPREIETGLEALAADLINGRWLARNGALLDKDMLDLGYRLLVGRATR
jgi:SAM-dependent methyltransferase